MIRLPNWLRRVVGMSPRLRGRRAIAWYPRLWNPSRSGTAPLWDLPIRMENIVHQLDMAVAP